MADQYRKLRNTFRYLLGALDGFSDVERVEPAAMPELERYVLALAGKLDATLRQAVSDYDFNTYVRALTDFCNEDLSAFFFDIRKDSLYCDAPSDPKRMAYRTTLDLLFHALIRWAAPVLVFTAEEVWGTRYPDDGSVHLLEWPEVPTTEVDLAKWAELREIRSLVTACIEPKRRNKELGSSLEADIELSLTDDAPDVDWSELFISGPVTIAAPTSNSQVVDEDGNVFEIRYLKGAKATRTEHHKCGRCWRHLPEVTEDGALCSRCDQVTEAMDTGA